MKAKNVSLKYKTTENTVVILDAQGVQLTELDARAIPAQVGKQLLVHGLKVLVQQRTSQLRAAGSASEIVAAMREVYDRLCAGEWQAERAAGEKRSATSLAALAQALINLGKFKGSLVSAMQKLSLRSKDEIKAIQNADGVMEEYNRVLAEAGEDEDFDLG